MNPDIPNTIPQDLIVPQYSILWCNVDVKNTIKVSRHSPIKILIISNALIVDD